MKKLNIKYIIFAILVLILIALLVQPIRQKLYSIYNYYTNNGETMKDPGSGPSDEEQRELDVYYRKCPLEEASIGLYNSNFEVSVKCSENELFKDTVKKGEDGKVEIYTQDFEQGKQIFRDWLKSKGLEESPTLRITYTHKPQ